MSMEGKALLPYRVLIADDHELLRTGISATVASEPDLEMVGEAEDGEETLELCRKLHPDLVPMDLSMPRMDGISATQAIKSEFPRTGVLVLTAHADQRMLLDAIRAGAIGYELKGVGPSELVGAGRRTLEGESPVVQELVMRLVRRLAEKVDSPTDRAPTRNRAQPLSEWFTPRELEVLRLLPAGKTNREIAQELHLSLSTVKKHLERLIAKLEVSDRTRAAVKALDLGLVDSERTKQ
jgi:DNA-binding NarL/FixJ family response regulator